MVGNDIPEVANTFEGSRCFYWVLPYISSWEVRFMKIKGTNVYMSCGWNWSKSQNPLVLVKEYTKHS